MEQQSSLLGTDAQPVAPPTSDEKVMALLSHVLTLVAGFLAPLIIWLVKKDDSQFVAAHGRSLPDCLQSFQNLYTIGTITIRGERHYILRFCTHKVVQMRGKMPFGLNPTKVHKMKGLDNKIALF